MVFVLFAGTEGFVDFLIVPALIILIAVPVVWIKSRIRNRRMKRLESLSPEERAEVFKKTKKSADGREMAMDLVSKAESVDTIGRIN